MTTPWLASGYHAFLSYAHEDRETVEWLETLLSDYWVPGVRRRSIYRDHRRVTARSLDGQLTDALRASAKPCGEEWIERALPPQEPWQVANHAISLAIHGYQAKALELARRSDFPPAEKLSLQVALHAGGLESAEAVPPAVLSSWVQDRDPFDQLYDALGLLAQLEDASLSTSPLALQLLDVAVAAAGEWPDGASVAWPHKQRLAAHLALAGRTAEAKQILDRTAPGSGAPFDDLLEDEAAGWAWRGLAWHRLGQHKKAAECLDAAEHAASKPYEASRTWEEWFDLAEVYALTGNWKKAFATTDGPREERMRVRLRCRLVELWTKHRLGLRGLP